MSCVQFLTGRRWFHQIVEGSLIKRQQKKDSHSIVGEGKERCHLHYRPFAKPLLKVFCLTPCKSTAREHSFEVANPILDVLVPSCRLFHILLCSWILRRKATYFQYYIRFLSIPKRVSRVSVVQEFVATSSLRAKAKHSIGYITFIHSRYSL